MSTISILLILLSLIIFSILIYKLNTDIIGGEYIPTYVDKWDNRHSLNPSISQICWDNYTKIKRDIILANIGLNNESSKLISNLLIEDSYEMLTKNAGYIFNNERRMSRNMTEMRTISDANLDMLGILLLSSKRIDEGYAVCEWHGNGYGEGSEFISEYTTNNISLINVRENSDTVELMKNYIDRSIVKIYLEFTYGNDQRSFLYYNNIHKFTFELISNIINNLAFSSNIIIIAIRVQVNSTNVLVSPEDVVKKLNTYNGNGFTLKIYDQAKYTNLVIPDSSVLSYDEEMVFRINDSFIEIQIEYSENGERHKSNYMEFLARNLEPLIVSKKEFFDCLSRTNYNYKPKTKVFTEKGDVKFVHNMSFVPQSNAFMKAFGKFNDML